jgi:hypothetical protein
MHISIHIESNIHTQHLHKRIRNDIICCIFQVQLISSIEWQDPNTTASHFQILEFLRKMNSEKLGYCGDQSSFYSCVQPQKMKVNVITCKGKKGFSNVLLLWNDFLELDVVTKYHSHVHNRNNIWRIFQNVLSNAHMHHQRKIEIWLSCGIKQQNSYLRYCPCTVTVILTNSNNCGDRFLVKFDYFHNFS